MFYQLRAFLNIHRDMIVRFFLIDLFISLISLVYIISNNSQFDYTNNAAYLFVIFLSFIALYIGFIKKYIANTSFYLLLPLSRGKIVQLISFLQTAPILIFIGVITGVIYYFFDFGISPGISFRFLHVGVFIVLLKLSVLPVLILSAKHPLLVLMVAFILLPLYYFIENIDNAVLSKLPFRYFYDCLIFIVIYYLITTKILVSAKK